MKSLSKKLTSEEIASAFGPGSGCNVSPFLTTKEAADLLRIAPKTLDEWKNAGKLEGTYCKRGKVLYWRDRLAAKVFNEKE